MTPEEELIKLCDAADRLDTGFVGRLNARGFMATPDGIALARRHAALLAYEPRSWSVVIRALDSWHEINLQDSKCSCPAHKRVEVLRKELVEFEALATGWTK